MKSRTPPPMSQDDVEDTATFETLPAIGPEGRGEQLRILTTDPDGTTVVETVFVPWGLLPPRTP